MSDASRKKHVSPVPPEQPTDPPEGMRGTSPSHRRNLKSWTSLRRKECEKLWKNLEEFAEEVEEHLEDFRNDVSSMQEMVSAPISELQARLETINLLEEEAVRKLGKLSKFYNEEELLDFAEEADERYGRQLRCYKNRLQVLIDLQLEDKRRRRMIAVSFAMAFSDTAAAKLEVFTEPDGSLSLRKKNADLVEETETEESDTSSDEEEEPVVEPESPAPKQWWPSSDYWRNESQELEKRIQKFSNSPMRSQMKEGTLPSIEEV